MKRDNAPAEIIYFKNVTIKKETWFNDNRFHRADGPAIIEYYENVKKKLGGLMLTLIEKMSQLISNIMKM